MLILLLLIFVHVYHSHAAYLKSILNGSLLEEEAERILRVCGLREPVCLGIILDVSDTDILEDHANVL